ncbi:MAG: phosphate ABC transporter substrate-binding protein PstS [Gemmatimonadetes bacterium]|nr:phosphate ABC transporter substrate-binding protein PstS [Gemmatimonadota bacterium]
MTGPRSLTWLRAAVLIWIGVLGGFAAGMEWIRTRPAPPPPPSGGIDLVGAGATFPYPLYRRWFAEYRDASGVRINYFSVGSGEGIRLLFEEEMDFGAIDRPLRADERARARCGPVEIPTVIGAIAVVVNLPRIFSAVRLDAPTLAGIYLGRITQWDDPALRALNPSLALPAIPIRVIQRARSSGTSEVFADYLATTAIWRAAQEDAAGAGRTDWPAGERVEGNEGVAAQVRATEGALGFVELSYAQQSRLATAALRNVAGAYVRPDSLSLARTAAELLTGARADTLHGLVGARDAAAYPVAAITRLVVDRALGDSTRGAHFLAFARWALREGAHSARALGYAPLPGSELRRQVERLDALTPGICPSPRTI